MKWFRALCAACLLAAAPLVHAGPDEEYISIYQSIEEADLALAANQSGAARSKFQSAQDALKRFKATYPTWNAGTVDFRLQYVTDKLAKLGGPAPAAAPAIAPKTTAPADPAEELRQTIAQLQEERKVLTAKLQEALSAQPAAVDPRELQKAETQINSLQKERDLLKVALEQERAKVAKAEDKSGLETAQKEIAALRAQVAASAAPVAASEREVTAAREAASANALAVTALQTALKQMREERDAALARASAPAPSASKNATGGDALLLATLRARVEVLEARKVPFTAEELAAMKQGPNTPRPAPVKTEAKRKELPPGAGIIIQEAQRAFANKRFDEAEKKYQQILEMDNGNIFTLGNLGLIQMEAGRLNDAEATLMKANSLEANDAFILSQLGILRFRQKKIDEAVNLLSRSAELEPKNPETHNYLGIALSEKGLRGPAEAELRKSLELNPNYPDAHHNLAVIYATQQPPFVELARYHYKKGRDLGMPADATVEKLLNQPKP